MIQDLNITLWFQNLFLLLSNVVWWLVTICAVRLNELVWKWSGNKSSQLTINAFLSYTLWQEVGGRKFQLESCHTPQLSYCWLFPYSADFEYTYFWKWTRFSDYCLFVLLLFLVGGIITVLLLNVTVYVELLGFASLLLEACLGVPQFWRNFSNKSTEGMRSENA